MPAKFVLGLNTLQLNKDHDYGGVVDNQLRTLEHIGAFTAPLPSPPADLPRLVDYQDDGQDLAARARSYLHANCAHCHMKWGGGNAEFQLLYTLDLGDTGTVGVRPGHGAFGLPDPKVLVPGDPSRSMVHHRMTRLGLGRMPHVASNLIDEEGVRLVGEWIKHLPPAE
jgi:mono/diheme cytochrome c family protein